VPITLYADDATIILPDSTEVSGAPAIQSLRTEIFARGAPFPTVGRRVIGDSAVALETKTGLAGAASAASPTSTP
jgi:hypothetical protein